MACVNLKVAFAKDSQLNKFLGLLRYMQWCGDVGHSGSVSVHFDGDGDFSMEVVIVDPETGNGDNLRDLVKFGEDDWKALRKAHRDFQFEHKMPEHRDGNEFAISMGD